MIFTPSYFVAAAVPHAEGCFYYPEGSLGYVRDIVTLSVEAPMFNDQ
jgi:hypothetical protein